MAGAGAVATAGVFLTLDAEFLAAVQVLLYAGGVVTVVVFAIVVTERLVGERLSHTSRHVAAGGPCSRRCSLLLRPRDVDAQIDMPRPPLAGDLTRQIGIVAADRFALPFELLARAAARRLCSPRATSRGRRSSDGTLRPI